MGSARIMKLLFRLPHDDVHAEVSHLTAYAFALARDHTEGGFEN